MSNKAINFSDVLDMENLGNIPTVNEIDHTLIAPNETIASEWRKLYPGWRVLLATPLPPHPKEKQDVK